MTIEFRKTAPDKRPHGKIADAQVKFDDIRYGPLGGCALVGFALWEPPNDTETPRVTVPARVYDVNGERRSYDLLRPVDPDSSTQPLRDAIAAAWLRIGEKSGEIELEEER